MSAPADADADDVDLPDDWQFEIGPPPPWHRDVVEVLQEALDDARRGVVTDVAVAVVRRDGRVASAFAGRGDRTRMVACGTYLLHRLLTEL